MNANESFNSTVWHLAPKYLHCGIKNYWNCNVLGCWSVQQRSFVHFVYHEYAGYHNRQAK